MLIRVMYADGRLGMVKPHLLDNLVEGKVVTSFLRSDGWVAVGQDVIRRRRSSHDYGGTDRRTSHVSKDPLGRGLTLKLFQEFSWIAGVLILASVLFTSLL